MTSGQCQRKVPHDFIRWDGTEEGVETVRTWLRDRCISGMGLSSGLDRRTGRKMLFADGERCEYCAMFSYEGDYLVHTGPNTVDVVSEENFHATYEVVL